MNNKFSFLLASFLVIFVLMFSACKKPAGSNKSTGSKSSKTSDNKGGKKLLKFTGGPSGGTFQYFSNGMSTYISKHVPGLSLSNQSSAGSTENIRKVDSGRADFGIAYSGDTYLARNGRLSGDTKKYTNVRAIAFLYKAPAQLATLKKSGIKSVADLEGKKVDIGGPGSGAAASAQRYFETVGLWGKFTASNLGYNKAAQAIKDGHIDAMWILAGYPTSALINLSSTHDIIMLDVYKPGVKAGLTKKHPFYQPLKIPAKTYKGVDKEVDSFFDSALWVVGAHVSEETVYKAMKAVFTDDGLKYLINVKKTAKQMSVKGGLTGIVTPLHKGAAKFWKEMGLTIPANATAK